ncbi:MFS transporter [Altererythrobacter sp. GH1-8]|uniref:MFS transporter n=1 Tax=Altererythrobacter sp. GH1-8 TaxID=3349333 RepID=UPI00374D8FF6
MTPGAQERSERQPLWFLLLLALAAAGGAVAYVPFLTVLLPVRVRDLAGDQAVDVLAYATFAGAFIASLANIAFGWASDVTRNRRGWIATGMIVSGALLVSVRWADTVPQLVAVIMAWQFGLNMLLAPILAWGGDCVPDEQKGLLGGLLAFAPAIGALSGALVTIPGLFDPDSRLVVVAGLVILMVSPALLFGKGRRLPLLMEPSIARSPAAGTPLAPQSPVRRMWTARLAVQIAEAGLFAFLVFWLSSLDIGLDESDSARLFSIVLVISVPLALLAGRWSDKADRPFIPLAIAAAISALGLLSMALAPNAQLAIAGYMVFGIASMIFLALHSSQTLRVLPRPQTRGRDLGVFNLTNTMPSMIVPWLAVSLVPVFGFEALFLVLAGLSLLAAVLVGSMIPRR